MKIKSLILATAVVAGLASNVASADTTGVINFEGQILSSTCAISTESTNQTVTLPTVPSSSLQANGDTAGDVSFKILLEDCSPGDIYARFSPLFNSGNIEGENVLNTGDAKNVAIAIYTAAGQKIDLRDENAGESASVASTDDSTVLDYIAKYYATGAAGAGSVEGKLVYDIVYK